MDSSSVTIAWHPRYWESVESPEGSLSASGVGNGGGTNTNAQSSATSSIISSEVSIGHDVVNMGSNGLSNSFVHGSESGSNSNTATNGDGKNGIDSSAASGRNGLPSLLKGRKNKVKSFSDEDDDDNMGEDDDDEDWRGGRKEINRGGGMDEDDSYDDDDDIMLDDQGGEGEENDDIENDWHWTVAAAGDILDNLGSHLTDELGKNGKKGGHSGSGSTNSRKKRQTSFLSRNVPSKKLEVDKMQKDAALQESSVANMESDEESPRSLDRNPSSFLFSGGRSHLDDRTGNGDGDERESVKHISLEQIDRRGNIKKGKFGDNDDEDFVESDERKNGNNHNNNNSKGKVSGPSSTTRVPRVSPPTSVRSPSSVGMLYNNNNKKDSGAPSSSALSSGVKKSTLITYKVEYYSADEVRSEWLLGATDVSLEIFSLQYLKPNTEYVFFVRAVSPEGVVSAPSPLSDSVTTHISTSNRNSDDLEMAREKLGQGIVVLLKNAYPTSSTSIKIEWQVRIIEDR